MSELLQIQMNMLQIIYTYKRQTPPTDCSMNFQRDENVYGGSMYVIDVQ